VDSYSELILAKMSAMEKSIERAMELQFDTVNKNIDELKCSVGDIDCKLEDHSTRLTKLEAVSAVVVKVGYVAVIGTLSYVASLLMALFEHKP